MYSKSFIKTMAIMFVIYGLYFLSTIFQSDFWGNILSPIVGLYTFNILFKTVLIVKDKETFANKTIWGVFSLACLTWIIADTIWAFYYFLTAFNPEDSILISTLYSSTSIFLFVSIFIFGITRYKKWIMLQLLLDSICISLSTLLLLWILFLNEDLEILKIIITQYPTTILFIVVDILTLVIISIFYLSSKRVKIDAYINFVFAGVLIYVISDLYFYNLNFSDSYIPNSLIDYAFMCTFLFIAIGSIYKRYFVNFKNNEAKAYNHQKKQILLFIYPFLAIIIKGIDIPNITNFLLIILLNNVLSTYIQSYLKNAKLLIKEKEINLLLEEKIIQRTKEITDKNKELENKNKELDILSNKDSLTNLYNRRFFMENLEIELKLLNPIERVAFFYIDLDRFKTINDMYGHQVGDQALVEVSRRLENLNEGNYILARFGGDEFVLFTHGIFEYKHIEEIANTIIVKCSEPIEIGEYIFYVSASVGISIYPLDAKDSYTLMKNADIAMYEAKIQGKNRCVFFDDKFKDRINKKNEIESFLKKANYDDEFELFYQPQYSIKEKKIIGAEALLRWNNKDIGFISPEEFIPIAEEIDYINSIGEWAMEKAIIQIAKWQSNSIYLKVGINVSPKQLDNRNFISKLKGFMEENSVSSEYIDIEITENIAIEGEYRIRQIESLFSSLGVSISIDDFGTGYSSLSYLKIFPFERIKIAKPLIDVISTDSFDFQIVKAIIMLAKSIGIKTIAEGVEHQEQLDILTELGCDEVQGYLLGKPMPVSQFDKLLNSYNN